jgi:phage tail sheath protein FI
MPEYLAPGVYVEEVSSGIKPIEGVGTSTGAFVGRARKGPINKPQLITNPTQFATVFGSLHQDFNLGYGVANFFGEGGTRCYVVRVFKASSTTQDADRARFISTDNKLRVLALNEGLWGNNIFVQVEPPAFDPDDPGNLDGKFGLRVLYKKKADADLDPAADVVEVFDSLSMKELTTDGLPNPFHIENQINGKSAYIEVDDITADTSPPANFDPQPLTQGLDGAVLDSPTDFTGHSVNSPGVGLLAFDTVDDINIVAIPDLFHPGGLTRAEARIATQDGIKYCEGRKDCFFVADCAPGLNPTQAREYKQARGEFATNAGSALNSSFGALYYPWVKIFDPLRGRAIDFPPSCSVAGIYSATDISRGVHKAPAGIVEGRLKTAVGLERDVTKGEQETLNPNGVNVLRNFPESGLVVWGARTVSADPEWKYINVRRLFLFMEESIDEGTQWVVFEPNDPALWARIKQNIGAFLRIQWLEGKLVGLKEEEAFFVKCDEETNPPESVDLGRVITVIGVAPSKPAEFVIFRIMQKRPGANA